MRKFILFFMTLLVISSSAQKRKATFKDFEDWKSISNPTITDNGAYISYALKPGKGDDIMIIYNLSSGINDTLYRASGLKFSGTNELAVYKISPSQVQLREAKKNKLSKNKTPKDSLGIFIFSKDTVITYPKLKQFAIAKEGGNWLAFTSEEKYLPPKDTSHNDSIKVKPAKLPKGGDNMVIFDGNTEDTLLVRNVNSFLWSKNGKTLAYVTEKKDSVTTSRITYFDPLTKKHTPVFKVEGEIKRLTINNEGTKLAWLSSKDTLKTKTYELFYTSLETLNPILIADTNAVELPKNWAPSENGSIYFSKSGNRLFFGSAKRPEQAPEDTLLSGEKVSVDVWSWHDKVLQPEQKINFSRDSKQTFLAVYDINKRQILQLIEEPPYRINVDTDVDLKYALASNNIKTKRESSWTGKLLFDYYLVNLYNGNKNLLVENAEQGFLSPEQNYFIYALPTDSNYYILNLKTKKTRILNKGIPHMLVKEDNDIPIKPGYYGFAGWLNGDDYILIYDRYDIWKVSTKGKEEPLNLSNGRNKKLISRLIRLDYEKRSFSLNDTLLLSVFNDMSKASEWANLNISGEPKIQNITMDNKYFGRPVKAKKSSNMFYTRQDYDEYPDLWYCNRTFTQNKKISDANPQKKDLLWCSVELVNWNSFNGDKLEGLLYKPEDFDPSKKYPMLVYFYERNSYNLKRFQSLYPSHSTINKSFYASNGYLVFVPDIKYRIGYPGQSAYECIVSGVQSLTQKHAWIDEKHIGLQGQSWGGYQTAYLVTQTNMFAAGMAGAPVSNMTSAYGGIRWGTGMSRMFQYEHTQSRIGGTLWEKPLLYIENSPLFYANKVNTPLLIMHNDNDGAVPWYQGIEYFVALRRLDKPVWMLTYNGEPHNLKPSSWGNRMDLSIRMKQFFDHYLKDEDAPEWMLNGVKAINKEYMKGY